jgi:hypothetical protein
MTLRNTHAMIESTVEGQRTGSSVIVEGPVERKELYEK